MPNHKAKLTKKEYELYVAGIRKGYNNCVDDYNATGNIGQTRIIEPPKNRPKKCKNHTYYTNGTHRDNKSFTDKFEKALEETLGGKFDKNGVFRK